MLHCVAAVAAMAVVDPGLRDHPISAKAPPVYLDGEWKATNGKGGEMMGHVPGDVITDLQIAGKVGDPLYGMNFLKNEEWEQVEWSYERQFTVSQGDVDAGIMLVFEGIKMSAKIFVNGVQIGQALDQFLRYEFIITNHLKIGGDNKVTVTFDHGELDGRWMACTGGWDWAPYSQTQNQNANTFSYGIWKSVYLLQIGAFAVTYSTPHTFYQGAYPTKPLSDAAHGGFLVSVRVHTYSPRPIPDAKITVKGEWGQETVVPLTIPQHNTTHIVNLTADGVKLWWPNGMGDRPMYNVTVLVSGGGQTVVTDRRIGFKTLALVTGNDTDPAYVSANKNADGTNRGFGMLIRINGAVMFNRGGNMIPMEELEGRASSTNFKQLVKSSSAAGMNTYRVWGGGIFYPKVFYDTCDEEGILLYHDMMYAQGSHSPAVTATQDAELRHQMRRLSHHVSILMWDGCNECHVVIGTPTGIYATFVMDVVVQEDASHIVWPSCPANGWATGVNRLTSIPNGSPLGLDPVLLTSEGGDIETHGPYQHGDIFETINMGPFTNTTITTPPTLTEGDNGPMYPNIFASEFGTVVMSSFESMSPMLDKANWALHGGAAEGACHSGVSENKSCDGTNPMQQRNYGCDNLLLKHFGWGAGNPVVMNTTGEVAFKKQLYLCMLAQALDMKSNIEQRRATNQFGIIVWQLNEIWPTGGWGSLEYGTTTPWATGQVMGGRWKPLHHIYNQILFKNVIVVCGKNWRCYAKNNGLASLQAVVKVDAYDLHPTGFPSPQTTFTQHFSIPGEGGAVYFHIPHVNPASQVLVPSVADAATGDVLAENLCLMAYPYELQIPPAPKVEISSVTDGENGVFNVEVSSNGLAMYVTLTTLAQGYFSENVFFMTAAKKVVEFRPFAEGQGGVLRSSVRVEDLSLYM